MSYATQTPHLLQPHECLPKIVLFRRFLHGRLNRNDKIIETSQLKSHDSDKYEAQFNNIHVSTHCYSLNYTSPYHSSQSWLFMPHQSRIHLIRLYSVQIHTVYDAIMCFFMSKHTVSNSALGCTVEVWEWISNLIPYFTIDVIAYPCLQKGPHILHASC